MGPHKGEHRFQGLTIALFPKTILGQVCGDRRCKWAGAKHRINGWIQAAKGAPRAATIYRSAQ